MRNIFAWTVKFAIKKTYFVVKIWLKIVRFKQFANKHEILDPNNHAGKKILENQ